MLYFIGGAGNGNFGDELIVKGWLDYLAAAGISDSIVVEGNNARIASGIFGRSHPGIGFSHEISRLKSTGPKTFFECLTRGIRFFDNGGFGNYPNLRRYDQVFAGIRVLHLHGGGYINSLWPNNAFYLGFASAAKRRFGCRVVGTGLGLLPAPEVPDDLVAPFRAAIEAFDLIELRDRWSYDYLRKLSDSPAILLGLDDSFLISGPPDPGPGPRTLHLSFFASADRFDKVVEFAGSDRAQGFERALFWACTDQDRGCFEELRRVLPRLELASWEELVAGPLPVAPGDFMVTARFHPHLLAARLGAGGVFREDRGYYDVKHSSVVDLGSPFRPLRGAIDPGCPRGGFSAIHAFDDLRVGIKRRLADQVYTGRG